MPLLALFKGQNIGLATQIHIKFLHFQRMKLFFLYSFKKDFNVAVVLLTTLTNDCDVEDINLKIGKERMF